MPKVVMTHAVVDTERWLKGKAERAAALSAFATNVTDYAAADGSNNIAVTADIQDVAPAQAAGLETPSLRVSDEIARLCGLPISAWSRFMLSDTSSSETDTSGETRLRTTLPKASEAVTCSPSVERGMPRCGVVDFFQKHFHREQRPRR